MNTILSLMEKLTAQDLETLLLRGKEMLDKKKAEEAALLKAERERQEKLEMEKKRLQEIARLQEKLKELQSQGAYVPDDVRGANFVMRETASDKTSQPVNTLTCPHCNSLNPAGSAYCIGCGKLIASSPAPSVSSKPAPAPQPQPMTAASVRYADETMKKWLYLPGEKVEMSSHQVHFTEPDMGKKYSYSMEVTNKRILFTRIGAAAAHVGVAFGLVGTLARDLTNNGPKPWLEIPFEAIKNYGMIDKKEFFIEADRTYVLKDKNYNRLFSRLIG